ncbi:uncharacterized protein EI90DRAFT_3119174 [Cantharellus anzutake]|uniref:uncharacterized protein n=1 Tax=Cantharellus anzutake TaxID=1750568 RepID=UPI001905157E|nr:uncharacterized protein EI90DRAFT_3119174 [Cantharellus anzutake]KAF8336844.1 hypothetical protein EI90DRAFT_3119174 [Cantharellus anzutake]
MARRPATLNLRDNDLSTLPSFSEDPTPSSSSVFPQRRRPTAAHPFDQSRLRPWGPFHLRTHVMVFIVVLCFCFAIALEAALHFNQKAFGWPLPRFAKRIKNFHVLLTAVPGLLGWVLALHMNEVDRNIKVLQPYVDMTKGKATAERSVLLDYSQKIQISVLPATLRNGHLTAFLSTTLCLICVVLSPLSTSYIYYQAPPPEFNIPLKNVQVQERLGLPSSLDLVRVDAAAGFMKAASSFQLSPPPFVRFLPGGSWAATRVNLSSPINEAGVASAEIVCIKSTSNCSNADSVAYNVGTGVISGVSQKFQCSFQTVASDSPGFNEAPYPYGITVCNDGRNPFSSPVVFWMLENVGGYSNPQPLATVCVGEIFLNKATASLNSSTLSLLRIVDGGPPGTEELARIDLNNTPFNGTAFNGLFPSNASATEWDRTMLNSAVHSVGKAVVQSVVAGMQANPTADVLTSAASQVYGHYLGMVSSIMYYTPLENTTVSGGLNPASDRLFISEAITHVLAALFFLIALGAIFVIVLHQRDIANLRLFTPPGTIAAAVAIAGQSKLSSLLAEEDTVTDMKIKLSDLSFSLDTSTGRLRVEEGYTAGYAEGPHTYNLVARSPRLAQGFSPQSSPRHRYTPLSGSSTA